MTNDNAEPSRGPCLLFVVVIIETIIIIYANYDFIDFLR